MAEGQSSRLERQSQQWAAMAVSQLGQRVVAALDGLVEGGQPQLRGRPERLLSQLGVQLETGAALDRLGISGRAAVEAARALAYSAVSALPLPAGSVVGLCTRTRQAGAPDMVVVLADGPTDAGAAARGILLQEDRLRGTLRGRDVAVGVRPCLPHLSRGVVQVTFYGLPYEYLREGLTQTVLSAAGYGPGRCRIQAEFLGDLPREQGGGSGLANCDVVVALVWPPDGDPQLRDLPRHLDMGWDARARVQVRSAFAQQDAPPPPPPPQPSPAGTQQHVQALGERGNGRGVGGRGQGAAGAPQESAGVQAAAVQARVPQQQGAALGGGRGAATGSAEPMVVDRRGSSRPWDMPDCPLAEACYAFLEDNLERSPPVTAAEMRAVVAVVAQGRGPSWAVDQGRRDVPVWLRNELLAQAVDSIAGVDLV